MKFKYIARFFISSFLVIMLFGTAANAETLSFYDYDLTLITDGTNPFGMNDGDIVTISITVDSDSGISDGGYTTHNYATDGDAFELSFSLGLEDFDETDDTLWSNWPAVSISDTDNLVNVIDFGSIRDNYLVSIGVAGAGDPITLTVSTIPEPGTLILFGLGLFSLAGLQRKQSLK